MGPEQKEYAVHAGVLRRHFTGISSSIGKYRKFTLRIQSDIEDIFGYILQYMYIRDYSILAPAYNSAHITGEAELNTEYLRLRDKYLTNQMSTKHFLNKLAGVFSQDLRSPFREEKSYPCKYPEVLLTHARLHIFAKGQGLDMLGRLSLWKLVYALLV